MKQQVVMITVNASLMQMEYWVVTLLVMELLLLLNTYCNLCFLDRLSNSLLDECYYIFNVTLQNTQLARFGGIPIIFPLMDLLTTNMNLVAPVVTALQKQ